MLNLLDRWFSRKRARAFPDGNSLDAFGSEQGSDGPAGAGRSATDPRIVFLAGLVVLAGIAGYFLNHWRPLQAAPSSATVTIQSDPLGAEVFAAETRRGTTPLTLSLPAGDHEFEVLHEGRRKTVSVRAQAGAVVVHHVAFETVVPVTPTAALEVITEPARLQVLVNGTPRGLSPLKLTDLQAGAHRVKVVGTAGTIERKVELGAGESASVIISTTAPAAGPAAGWISVTSAFPVQILDGRDVVGSSQSPRIMLPIGKHSLTIQNEALGYKQQRVVQVTAGKTAAIALDRPRGRLSINALPWAEVWIDGTRLGETPIGNYPVGIGTREIVFRHPELGERRQSVVVKLGSPGRVTVDMRSSN